MKLYIIGVSEFFFGFKFFILESLGFFSFGEGGGVGIFLIRGFLGFFRVESNVYLF